MNPDRPRRYRTLFICDVHLGSKPAKAEYLIDFLSYHEADTIHVVGDIEPPGRTNVRPAAISQSGRA